MIRIVCLFLALLVYNLAGAQQPAFTHADSLRGSITPERAWWDLTYYHLQVRVHPDDSTLSGSTTLHYQVVNPLQVMQIDLQKPLRVLKIEQDGQSLSYRQDGNAYFVTLTKPQVAGQKGVLTVHYNGKPRVARKPPWDGGLTWSRDTTGQWFIATSCQGLGASAWWPCKDHMYDEPDSMLISATVPDNLMDISNGTLRGVVKNPDGTQTYHWFVANPINNYGVNLNVANYTHWAETYPGEKGPLSLHFYVLPEHEKAARQQFKQVPQMLKAFEHWFGPYPFYEDGYKLVEVPYLGMEHQSSVTYGNQFRNGYLGKDLSGTGWGLKWDFIIVHESGHEWFANNITYRDIADMWVHESFANYSESLFTEYYYGKKAGTEYVIGCRKLIRNDQPIVGPYGVNQPGSGDMYPKGGNMLHTIRQIVDNDERWRQLMRGMNRQFYHQTVTGQQIEAYMSRQTGRNLQKVFDQYLRDTRIPVLEYRAEKGQLQYRWTNCVPGFDMPVKVSVDQSPSYQWLTPKTEWQTLKAERATDLTADSNFYIQVRKVNQPSH